MDSGFGMGPIPGGKQNPYKPPDPNAQLAPENARLVVLNGPCEGREFAISAAEVSVGRSDPPDVAVDIDLTPCEMGEIPYVSRVHAEFQWRDGALTLRDMGSTNGTYVGTDRLMGSEPKQPSAARRVDEGVEVTFANLRCRIVRKENIAGQE